MQLPCALLRVCSARVRSVLVLPAPPVWSGGLGKLLSRWLNLTPCALLVGGDRFLPHFDFDFDLLDTLETGSTRLAVCNEDWGDVH